MSGKTGNRSVLGFTSEQYGCLCSLLRSLRIAHLKDLYRIFARRGLGVSASTSPEASRPHLFRMAG